jgi:hypothetical protein
MQTGQIPPCLFALRSDGARQEYEAIAQALVTADRMTVHSHRVLCSYAAQMDSVIIATEQGKPRRASWFTQMDRARAKLKLHELEKHVATIPRPPNKFALAGFASRPRT